MPAELPVQITADLSRFNRSVADAKGNADKLTKSLGQSKEQAALVAAGAARISPELGNVVNTGSAALGVVKALGLSMGIVAGAAAAVGAAFVKASSDLDAAEEHVNENAKAAIKAQLGIVDANYYVNQAIEKQEKASAEKRKGYWRDWARSALDAIDAVASVIPGVATATDFYRKKLDALDALQQSNIATLESARDRYIELAAAQQEVIEKEKEGKKVAQEWLQFEAEWLKAAAERADLLEQVAQREQDEEDYAFEQRRKKSIEDAENRVKATEDAIELAKKQRDAEVDMAFQVADAFASATSEIFGDTKGGAIAAAIINVALAATKSLTAAPFPANVALAGLTVAAGAAQIQKIQSTNYAHSGLAYEPPGMAPDESVWVKRKNERMLTERGVEAIGGDSQIRRLNAGQPVSMGSRFVGITQFKHKVLDATIGPNIARPAAARTEIKAIAQTGGRVGHRLRSTT